MVEVAFTSDSGKFFTRIVGFSLLFHAAIIFLIVGAFWLKPAPKDTKIPVFELMRLPPPKGVHHPQPPPPPAPEKPKAEPTKPEPVKPTKQQPPEIKPAAKPLPTTKQAPTPAPTKPTPAPPTTAQQPQTIDPNPNAPEGDPNGMDLPDFKDQPQIRTVESMLIDPLMQVYLEQLQMILMQNFNPPDGLKIMKGSRTTVQFTIDRSGHISDIHLKRSSSNSTWDRLSTRAVSMAHLPPLPPNYRAPVLPLVFDFKEK